jgi:uncharacterized membrane protein
VLWFAAAAALLWLMALLVAPLLPVPASAAIYAIGSYICHQRPERSFELAGAQLPVCARCLGLYGGAALGAVIAPHLWRLGAWHRPPGSWRTHSWCPPFLAAGASYAKVAAGPPRPQIFILLSLLPAVISLVVEWAGLGQPGNVVRALTGMVAGGVIAAVVLATLHYERCAPPRPIVPNRPPTPI